MIIKKSNSAVIRWLLLGLGSRHKIENGSSSGINESIQGVIDL